jgi:hypothetical protein
VQHQENMGRSSSENRTSSHKHRLVMTLLFITVSSYSHVSQSLRIPWPSAIAHPRHMSNITREK